MPFEVLLNTKLRAALTCGIGFGILSALPYIGVVNRLCGVLFIAGGLLSSYLYFRTAPPAVARSYGTGASAGLLAGVFGGLVHGPLAALLLTDAAEAAAAVAQFESTGFETSEFLRDAMGMYGVTPTRVMSVTISGVVGYTLAGMLGGMIGTAIARKQLEENA